MAGDIGQVITTVGCNVNLPNLREKLLNVIKATDDAVSEQVKANGRIYTMQIHSALLASYDRNNGERSLLLSIRPTSPQAEREKSVIGMISQLFINAESLDKSFKKLPKIIGEQFGFPYVSIELYDENSNEFIVSGTFGIPRSHSEELRISSDATICGIVVNREGPYYIENASEVRDLQYPLLDNVQIETMFCIPLRIRDKTFGVMVLADVKKRKDLEAFRETIKLIANHLSLEINRKQIEDTRNIGRQLFRELYFKAPVPFLSSQSEKGLIVDCNNAASIFWVIHGSRFSKKAYSRCLRTMTPGEKREENL